MRGVQDWGTQAELEPLEELVEVILRKTRRQDSKQGREKLYKEGRGARINRELKGSGAWHQPRGRGAVAFSVALVHRSYWSRGGFGTPKLLIQRETKVLCHMTSSAGGGDAALLTRGLPGDSTSIVRTLQL